MRAGELLSGLARITEIRCDDIAARRVTLVWTGDPGLSADCAYV